MAKRPRTLQRARVLRRQVTLPEVLLWPVLRGNRLAGLRFRRQHPIGPYILDFYCVNAELAVEIDGSSHDSPDRVAHDERRTTWLRERGIRTLRIVAQDVLARDGLDGVLATIEAACDVAADPPLLAGRWRAAPEGC